MEEKCTGKRRRVRGAVPTVSTCTHVVGASQPQGTAIFPAKHDSATSSSEGHQQDSTHQGLDSSKSDEEFSSIIGDSGFQQLIQSSESSLEAEAEFAGLDISSSSSADNTLEETRSSELILGRSFVPPDAFSDSASTFDSKETPQFMIFLDADSKITIIPLRQGTDIGAAWSLDNHDSAANHPFSVWEQHDYIRRLLDPLSAMEDGGILSTFSPSRLEESLFLKSGQKITDPRMWPAGFDARIFSRSVRLRPGQKPLRCQYNLRGNNKVFEVFHQTHVEMARHYSASKALNLILNHENSKAALAPEFDRLAAAFFNGDSIPEDLDEIPDPGSLIRDTNAMTIKNYRVTYNTGGWTNILNEKLLEDRVLFIFLRDLILANELEHACLTKTAWNGVRVYRHKDYQATLDSIKEKKIMTFCVPTLRDTPEPVNDLLNCSDTSGLADGESYMATVVDSGPETTSRPLKLPKKKKGLRKKSIGRNKANAKQITDDSTEVGDDENHEAFENRLFMKLEEAITSPQNVINESETTVSTSFQDRRLIKSFDSFDPTKRESDAKYVVTDDSTWQTVKSKTSNRPRGSIKHLAEPMDVKELSGLNGQVSQQGNISSKQHGVNPHTPKPAVTNHERLSLNASQHAINRKGPRPLQNMSSIRVFDLAEYPAMPTKPPESTTPSRSGLQIKRLDNDNREQSKGDIADPTSAAHRNQPAPDMSCNIDQHQLVSECATVPQIQVEATEVKVATSEPVISQINHLSPCLNVNQLSIDSPIPRRMEAENVTTGSHIDAPSIKSNALVGGPGETSGPENCSIDGNLPKQSSSLDISGLDMTLSEGKIRQPQQESLIPELEKPPASVDVLEINQQSPNASPALNSPESLQYTSTEKSLDSIPMDVKSVTEISEHSQTTSNSEITVVHNLQYNISTNPLTPIELPNCSSSGINSNPNTDSSSPNPTSYLGASEPEILKNIPAGAPNALSSYQSGIMITSNALFRGTSSLSSASSQGHGSLVHSPDYTTTGAPLSYFGSGGNLSTSLASMPHYPLNLNFEPSYQGPILKHGMIGSNQKIHANNQGLTTLAGQHSSSSSHTSFKWKDPRHFSNAEVIFTLVRPKGDPIKSALNRALNVCFLIYHQQVLIFLFRLIRHFILDLEEFGLCPHEDINGIVFDEFKQQFSKEFNFDVSIFENNLRIFEFQREFEFAEPILAELESIYPILRYWNREI
ncbi:hypothetical protein G7Y89_g10024 [Cudoniella acicularis]|uniref:Uncharacterized protein n=1 Tax=Cudoniella acicularis TaxID=354080 RepID=A0A8H4W208_9HELO|nr:hypothetical protein G7Y89_g10024 [Cudoniella acicularis]